MWCFARICAVRLEGVKYARGGVLLLVKLQALVLKLLHGFFSRFWIVVANYVKRLTCNMDYKRIRNLLNKLKH